MKLSISKTAFLLIIATTFFLFSCQKGTNVQLIEKEDLVNILTDMHIADALLATKGMYDGKLKDTTRSYYNYILKKYDISRADFEHTLKYYGENPDEYLLIYDEVIANIDEKMPRKLDPNSIYKLFDIALEKAEILSDLEKYYGVNGRELWTGRRDAKLPRDTSSLKFNIEKGSEYPSLIAFVFDVKLDSKDTSRNLRAELEMVYKDSSSVTDTVFIKNNKEKKWESYKLIAKTDSLKEPAMVKARLFEQDNEKNVPVLDVRRLSIRQYAPDKDTSKLYYLPVRPDYDKPKNKKVERKPPLNKKINPKKKTNSGLKIVK